MPLAHLLLPQIARKTREIEAALGHAPTRAGYLATPPGAAVSERQGYAGLDTGREAALAGDDIRTRALEAMGSRGTHGSIDKAQVGDTGIEHAARVDRLGSKSTWTGDDLAGATDGEIAAARLLRKQREAEGVDPNVIQSPGYLPKIGVSGPRGNPHIDVQRSSLPLEGVRAGAGMGYDGRALGNTVDPGYKPVSLQDALRNASPEEAAQIIADDMQKRRPGYLPTI